MTQQTGPDGREMVKILIQDELNQALADGSVDRSMAASHGISRRPGRL